MSRRQHFSIPPRTPFSRSRRLESNLRTIGPLRHFSLSLKLSSAGVAPLSPSSRKLLEETVKTVAVFPSWLHLLDGEDNCMLSVPVSTSDLRYSCWQSGEICQLVSTGTFLVAVPRIVVFFEGLLLSFFLWSCPRVVCSMYPVFSAWHCVHSLLSFVATRILWHAGGLSRKPCVFLLLSLLDWLCMWWPVVVDLRQPMRNVFSRITEIGWSCNYVKLLLGFYPIPLSGRTVLDRIFWVRLGVLKKHYVMLRWEWFQSMWTTIRRTSSRLFRRVVFVCANTFLRVWYCRFQLRLSCPVTKSSTPLTSWAKLSEHEILVEHMVDIENATAEFREAYDRKHTSSSHMNSSRKLSATRSNVQRRLSIYNWNPGPRRGKEDAFEQQVAGRWHIITLQEASEYVDHELLTNRFHGTHYAGCAILFNNDTFYPARLACPSHWLSLSVLKCRAPSVCSRQILRNSSISQQSLAWLSW